MISVSKSYCYLKNSLCGLMVVVCFSTHAQTDSLFRAQDLCGQKRFDEAIKVIDKVVLNPETKSDPASWHIRSFAYLQSYKTKGANNITYVSRVDTSLASAIISNNLDKTGEYKENNKNFIKNASIIYYKLCSVYLQDSLNSEKSKAFYEKYKKATVAIEPGFDTKQKDLEYYTAMGSIFSELYINKNFDPKYGDIAKAALLKVLEIDPKNIKANLNLGVLYYNQGATLMRQMDYDVDLSQLDVIQENAKKLFKQSLPFMTQVYELDPKDKRVLEGLQGIYYSLNEFDKSNEFKQKLEKAQNQK